MSGVGSQVTVKLEARPVGPTSPVGSRLALIATVTDSRGTPQTKQKIEWILEGAGNILEVDDGPPGLVRLFSGRGSRRTTQNAISYTRSSPDRIAASSGSPAEVIVLEPGQTYCIISSSLEGESRVLARTPKNALPAILPLRWVDAEWLLPPTLADRGGTQQTLTTSVFRRSDHQPLAGCRVRYRVLDGLPAGFLPNHVTDATVSTDVSGRASITIAQLAAGQARNRVAVEITRPSDQTLLGQGKPWSNGRRRTCRWPARFLPLPTSGRTSPVRLTLDNTGTVGTRFLTVRTAIPEGVTYVRSNPPAYQDGSTLVWTLDQLLSRERRTLEAVYRPVRTGLVVSQASVSTGDGLRDERSFQVQVLPALRPQLKVEVSGATSALLQRDNLGIKAIPVSEQVVVSNIGTDSATNVVLRVELGPGLSHDSVPNPLEYNLGTLLPGGRRAVPFFVKPSQPGKASIRMSALTNGQVLGSAEQSVLVLLAGVSLKVTGPNVRVCRPAANLGFGGSQHRRDAADTGDRRRPVAPGTGLCQRQQRRPTAGPRGGLDD